MSNKVSVLKSGKKNFPWYVSYPDGGKRRKKYFKTKERKGGADEWAAEKRSALAEQGSKHAAVTEAEFKAVIEFRAAISKLPDHAQSITLADAVTNFTKGLQSRHRSISCQDVTDKLIAKLLAEGKSKSHRDSLEYRLKRFNAEYGEWLACDVTPEAIDDFLGNLKVGAQTKLHYRRAIGQMFNHAIKLKAAPENPITDTIRPTVKPAATEILKPGQVAKLLSHANPDTLPGLAVSFFAGVRRAEMERLDWSEIDLDEGFIEITATNAKTAQRRLIPISDNLKAWLAPYARPDGRVVKSPAIWRNGQEKARKAAKLAEWPHNSGRHSFASYHLAQHNDPGKLSMELGHPDPQMLYSHYRKLVTAKAAKAYWEIFPKEDSSIIDIKSA